MVIPESVEDGSATSAVTKLEKKSLSWKVFCDILSLCLFQCYFCSKGR